MRKIILFLFILSIFWSLDAYADVAGLSNKGLLDDMVAKYKTAASSWGVQMVSYASWLFMALALISLTWTYGLLALSKSDINDFLLETIRFSIPLGFFYWILANGTSIAGSILQTMPMMAANASSLGYDLSPSGIIDVGFYVISKIINNASFFQPVDTFMSFTIGLIILIVLALIAKDLLLLLVAGWILAYGGVFLLGFGGGRWLSDIAINYYKTILSIGVQAFGMVLVVGIGRSFIDQYLASMATASGVPYEQLIPILITSIMLFGLASSIPKILGGIVGHTGVSGYGNVGFGSVGVSSMIGAASTAIAAMTVATNSLAGAAASLGANALGAGSMVGAAMDAGRSEGAASNAAYDKVAASAESLAKTTSPSMALARGMGAVAGDKIDSIKDSIGQRVDQTIPGQIANAIKSDSAAGRGNSLSAGGSDKKG
jgi:type IV secretion system protein TrbL